MADIQTEIVDIPDNLESEDLQSKTQEFPEDPVGPPMIINITTLDPNKYGEAIENFRANFGVRFVLGVPVLTPVITDKDKRYPKDVTLYDVILESADNVNVTLRFRRDNLYLIGYRAMDGKWYELAKKKSKLIKGSVPIEMEDDYTDIMEKIKISKLTSFETPNYASLYDATTGLAEEIYRKGENLENRAKRLLRLALMISEAARSVPVLEFFKFMFNNSKGTRIPEGVNKLIHMWESNSEVIINGEKNPARVLTKEEKVDVKIEDEKKQIYSKQIIAQTVHELSQIVGILHGGKRKIRSEKEVVKEI